VIKVTQFIDDVLGKKAAPPKKPEPLDLVDPKEGNFPWGLFFPGTRSTLSEGNWEVDKDQVRLIHAGEKDEITFSRFWKTG